MFKVLFLTTVAALGFANPIMAEQVLTDQLKPCIDKELKGFRYTPNVERVEIRDHFKFEGVDYYQAYASGKQEGWIFYMRNTPRGCETVSSGFANPDADMLGLPKELRLQWTRKQVAKRIGEQGEKEFANSIQNYPGRFSDWEIQVFKEFGVYKLR